MNLDPNNLEHLYSQLPPQDRQAIAEQFINEYKKESTPEAKEFAKLNPKDVTPKQLAEMHQHARDKNPGLLGKVMQHPVVTGILGGVAAYEVDKHVQHR